MSPTESYLTAAFRPRVGIPWRTTDEQLQRKRDKLDFYFRAVQNSGAEPVEIALDLPTDQLEGQLQTLQGFVLPGSPADVDPARYGAARHQLTKTLDANRDRTDTIILAHAFAARKPVLAICYGCQVLNVYLGGTLVQDIPAALPARTHPVPHGTTDLAAGATKGDQRHDASLEPGSLLNQLAGATSAHINSSHHQSIDRPGEKLRVTAHAPDGVVEAVEWTGDSNWVVGVQWHPERMPEDALAQRLFEQFVATAKAREPVAHKT